MTDNQRMPKPLKLHFINVDPDIEDEKNYYIQSVDSQSEYLVSCDDPEEADWILITDFSEPYQFGLVHKLKVVSDYPEKSIIVTECDQPIEILPGLYSSGLSSCRIGRFIDGWHYPWLNRRFPNQQIQISNDEAISQKDFLATFLGYPSHIIRLRLVKLFGSYPDMDITVTKDYHHFEENDDLDSETAQKRYVNMIRKSHFSICPRGRGPSSMRLFDSMRFGVAPVIISDEWVKPSFVDWDACSLRIKEKHLSELHHILEEHKEDSLEMGRNARTIYENYFADECLPKTLRSALDQMTLSLTTPPNVSPLFVLITRLKRLVSFKTAFYKAVLYNRINRI